MTGQNGNIREQAPETDRLGAFVADLEGLRRAAGQPSLRKMAQVAHYSHTALSGVLAGTRLPSQELTLAFVRACGGDEDAWRDRWQRDDAFIHGTGGVEPRPAARRSPVPRWAVAAAASVATLAAVAALVSIIRADDDPAGQARGTAAPPIASPAAVDGADPQEQRCQFDAVSTATVPVPDPDPAQPPYGNLTLRYSPHCGAAWPLFVSTERVPTGATIRLRMTRPSDGAVSDFDYPFLLPSQVYSVFGNVLRTGPGCVTAAVEITAADDHRLLARAGTPCLQPGPAQPSAGGR